MNSAEKIAARLAAVGLLVVDDVDLLLLGVVEQVLGGELALDDVGGAGAEVRLEDALGVALAPVVALAEGGVGVGGGDLGEAGLLEDALHGLGDAGVEGADGSEDFLHADELGGVGLSGGGDGLVVEAFDLELDAGDLVVLVRGLGREVHGVLDALAECGEGAGERGVDTDDDGGLAAAVAVALAVVVARSAGGEGECTGGEHGGEDDQRTVSHERSFPWRGLLCVRCRDYAGLYWWIQGRAADTPGGAVTGRDSMGR